MGWGLCRVSRGGDGSFRATEKCLGWGFGVCRLPWLHQGFRGKILFFGLFLAEPDNIQGKHLRASKTIWELPLFFPHLLGAHIPSPGHVKAAEIWLARPPVFVPAGSPGSVPGAGREPWAPVQPRGCKTRPALSKQRGRDNV